MATEKVTNGGRNESRLLALPVELLHRVTDSLSDESLPNIRLTCKTFEATTNDRFARAFFESRYCCIYHKPRWDLLSDVLTSRFADRIWEVTFTSHVVEDYRLHPLQLAPRIPEGDLQKISMEASQRAAEQELSEAVGPRTQIPAWPNERTVERCLLSLNTLLHPPL